MPVCRDCNHIIIGDASKHTCPSPEVLQRKQVLLDQTTPEDLYDLERVSFSQLIFRCHTVL